MTDSARDTHKRVYNSSLPLVTPSFILFGLAISGHATAEGGREGGRERELQEKKGKRADRSMEGGRVRFVVRLRELCWIDSPLNAMKVKRITKPKVSKMGEA